MGLSEELSLIPKWSWYSATAGVGLLVGFGVGYYCGKKGVNEDNSPIVTITNKPSKTVDIVKTGKNLQKLQEPTDGEAIEPENPIVIEKVIIDAETFEAQIKAKEELNNQIEEIHERELKRSPRTMNNVFSEDSNSVWDYEKELETRDKSKPYIIHKDEFIENELDYSQETITYYVGDEIMADPSDTPLYGWFDMMGELHFGHGSEDPNVVYIRNDTLHYEWEILRHSGRFEIEVGGLTIEDEYTKQDLKHSNSPLKFRDF